MGAVSRSDTKQLAELIDLETRDANNLRANDDFEVELGTVWISSFGKDDVKQFLEFLDGKLTTNAPNWWRTIAVTAKPGNQGQAVFDKGDYWPYQKGKRPLANESIEILDQNDDQVLRSDGAEVSIKTIVEKVKTQNEGPIDIICVIKDANAIYIATMTHVTIPYTLWKVDFRTGELIWESKIEAGGYYPIRQGRGYHFAEMILDQDGNVFVFGAGPQELYLEKISSLGKVQFRFRTNNHSLRTKGSNDQ